MTEHSVSRTLVKSPPELWAELSDPASLARHLGEFGEINITRLEPEHTVAWEGEHARGTVALEPAGWGTKVTLEARVEGETEVAPPPVEEPIVVEEPVALVQEPVALVAEPAPVEAVAPAHEPARPGFLTRLFGRWRSGAAEEEAAEAAAPAAEEPGAEPEPMAEPEPVAEPEPAAEQQPVAEEADGGLPAVLTAALDALGSAHHRPFSRG